MGAIPASPGPILLPRVPYRIGPGRAATDFLATSECFPGGYPHIVKITTVIVNYYVAVISSAAGSFER